MEKKCPIRSKYLPFSVFEYAILSYIVRRPPSVGRVREMVIVTACKTLSLLAMKIKVKPTKISLLPNYNLKVVNRVSEMVWEFGWKWFGNLVEKGLEFGWK